MCKAGAVPSQLPNTQSNFPAAVLLLLGAAVSAKGASSPGALSLALVEQLTASDQLTGSGCEGTAPLPPGNTAVPRVLPRFRRNGEEGGRQLRQPWCKPLPVLSSCPDAPLSWRPPAAPRLQELLEALPLSHLCPCLGLRSSDWKVVCGQLSGGCIQPK